MAKRLMLALSIVATAAGIGTAQIADPNPPQNSRVFGPKDKKDKRATSRSLKGTVTDDTGRPLEGALVTLLNGSTNEQWTFITKQDGRYNFDNISFNIDYQVSARFKELKSEPRKLSQYDHSPKMVRILEVGEPVGSDASAKKESPEESKK